MLPAVGAIVGTRVNQSGQEFVLGLGVLGVRVGVPFDGVEARYVCVVPPEELVYSISE